MRLHLAGVVLLSAMSGCGDSGSGTGGGSGPANPQAYSALSQQLSSMATSYGTAANAAADVPGCRSVQTSYADQVRPMVDQMRAMSGGMDEQMGTMGRPADADFGCGADAMASELAHHGAVACTSAAMPANRAEGSRHAAAMVAWAGHQHSRADEMGGMMGMGGMGGAPPTATCHRNGDGTFTLGP